MFNLIYRTDGLNWLPLDRQHITVLPSPDAFETFQLEFIFSFAFSLCVTPLFEKLCFFTNLIAYISPKAADLFVCPQTLRSLHAQCMAVVCS